LDGSISGGQGVEIALVGRLGYLGTTMQVGDAVTERAPLAFSSGIVFFGSEGLKVLSVVHREFGAQDSSEFVVEFEGVLTHSMLDPNPFETLFEISNKLALEVAVKFAAQKPHDSATGKRGHGVQDQRGADRTEGRGALKRQVRGPFAFKNRPVVSNRKALEYFAVDGIEHSGEPIEVHRILGPGLLESAYQECLARELTLRQIPFEQEKPLPLEYKGAKLECGYRMDFLVAEMVVVEIKAADELLPIHQAQLLTYMKLGGWKVGLLINFHAPLLKKGIKRMVLVLED